MRNPAADFVQAYDAAMDFQAPFCCDVAGGSDESCRLQTPCKRRAESFPERIASEDIPTTQMFHRRALPAGTGRRPGQGRRDVAEDHVGRAARLPSHDIELVDCEPNDGRVTALTLAAGRLPPVWNREYPSNRAGTGPATVRPGFPCSPLRHGQAYFCPGT